MGSATPLDLQRAEIDHILQSGLFAKAPRLERFFRYVCERHLEGEADRIKEYSIATEALGRAACFDPKSDSIVRVEAHRLRKRLEAFYRDEGADHPVHISIPNGQYRPHFTLPADYSREPSDTASDLAQFSTVDVAALTTASPTDRIRGPGRWLLAALAVAALSVLGAGILVRHLRE